MWVYFYFKLIFLIFFVYRTMGLHFGQLYKIRNIVHYKLSPFEQKAFAGFFTNGFPNMIRRIREEIFYIVPRMYYLKFSCSEINQCLILHLLLTAMTGAYLLYSWATKTHDQLQRKNPADFENDE